MGFNLPPKVKKSYNYFCPKSVEENYLIWLKGKDLDSISNLTYDEQVKLSTLIDEYMDKKFEEFSRRNEEPKELGPCERVVSELVEMDKKFEKRMLDSLPSIPGNGEITHASIRLMDNSPPVGRMRMNGNSYSSIKSILSKLRDVEPDLVNPNE